MTNPNYGTLTPILYFLSRMDAHKKIHVVAMDKSPFATYAFNLAMNYACLDTDEIHLVFVARDRSVKREEITEYLHPFRETATGLGATSVHIVIAFGDHPGHQLLGYATEKKAETIFVGRRSTDSLDRFLLGSTSKFLVENSKCNVAIAKTDVAIRHSKSKEKE